VTQDLGQNDLPLIPIVVQAELCSRLTLTHALELAVDFQARELERVDSHVQDLVDEMEVMRNTVRNQQLLLMKLVHLSE